MDLLNPDFRNALFDWVEELKKKNLYVQIKDTYISPLEQAKLWKSGHSDSDIDQKIEWLKRNKCECIAEMLADAYASVGPFVTNLLPGCSWHNWGKAATYNLRKTIEDRVFSIHNTEFKVAVRLAQKCGLFTGCQLLPTRLRDDVIQMHQDTFPINSLTIQRINAKVKEWYDNQTH